MRKDNITLIHGDCMEYMRTLPDKAFDLAIVDPPYGSANSDFKGGGRFGQRFERYMEQDQRRTEQKIPPQQKNKQTQEDSKEERGQSDIDDAKPG